jgi:hypothetical protein
VSSPRRPIREVFRKAVTDGVERYGPEAVGVALIGAPITAYLVLVGGTVSTVAVAGPFFGLIVTVLTLARRRPGAPPAP